MSRSQRERVADVWRIVRAAQRLAVERGGNGLTDALVASTGLSRQGVDLVFDEHLELTPSDTEVAELVARAGSSPKIAIVLSANVFSGALRAIAVARAAAEEVVVRPSRREGVFARALISAIRAAGDLAIRVDDALDVRSIDKGELHVYGRDETISAVRASSRVPVLGHGSGMGLAFISGHAPLAASAEALARDVVAFDQRGCMSPRIALVVGDEARAALFAEHLHAALEARSAVIPRGTVPTGDLADITAYVSTMAFAGSALVGTSHAVGIARRSTPLVLPPSYRTVHVACIASVAEAAQTLTPVSRGVVVVGADDLDAARTFTPSGARLTKLGCMQKPPLDGPVDLRRQVSRS